MARKGVPEWSNEEEFVKFTEEENIRIYDEAEEAFLLWFPSAGWGPVPEMSEGNLARDAFHAGWEGALATL